jgi:hypothetical protein
VTPRDRAGLVLVRLKGLKNFIAYANGLRALADLGCNATNEDECESQEEFDRLVKEMDSR